MDTLIHDDHKKLLDKCDAVYMHLKPEPTGYIFYREERKLGELSREDAHPWLPKILYNDFIHILSINGEKKCFKWILREHPRAEKLLF